MFRMEKCVDVCVVCIEYKQPHTHTEKWNAACFLFLTQHFVLGLSGGLTVFIWVFITLSSFIRK